ncbi:MAG: NADP-dependent phosphogluconate dehydrogenase [Patescibacteria group bacterium]
MNNTNHIGLIGLGTMGASLARNLAHRAYKVAVYNRTFEKTEEFLNKYASEGEFQGCETLEDFVKSIQAPRRIILMVQAGAAVDEMLEKLMPLMEKGDSVMDGGNSFYKDTETRQKKFAERGLFFFGVGVSGGEKGALEGPSIMPGGPAEAWKLFQEPLEKIAAHDFEDRPCVAYMGAGGSGHAVKMVHNGIEYGMMQLIGEAYMLGANGEMFAEWSTGKLQGYLIEIAAKIFNKKEILEKILDVAGQKGTGIWTSQEALAHGVPVNTITEAVFARALSAKKNLRKHSEKPKALKSSAPFALPKEILESTLELGFLTCYTQGFDLLNEMNFSQKAKKSEIARVWQGGCIIRSQMLKMIKIAFEKNEEIHLFENEEIQKKIQENLPALRELVKTAVEKGIPVTAFGSVVAYIDTLATENLKGISLIQALRDCFGAHTYQRSDKDGTFHTDWESETPTS